VGTATNWVANRWEAGKRALLGETAGSTAGRTRPTQTIKTNSSTASTGTYSVAAKTVAPQNNLVSSPNAGATALSSPLISAGAAKGGTAPTGTSAGTRSFSSGSRILAPLAIESVQTWNGGSGLWDSPGAWSGSDWIQGNTAIFNSLPGTIFVDTETAGGLTFNVGGYTLDTGTLTLTTGTVITTNGGTTTFGSNLTLAAAVGSTLTKAGTGTLVLANTGSSVGANTSWFVQGGSLNNGTGLYNSILALATGTALGTSTGSQLTLDGGTLQFTANGGAGYASARTINVTANGGAIFDGGFAPGAGTSGGSAISPNIVIASGAGLNLVSSNKLQFSTGGIISGAGGINVYGPGTVILPQANTYTGTTNVLSGALNIQSATGLGSTAAGTSVSSGAALQLQGGITVGAEALTLNGTGVSNDGALRNISGNNTYGGAITLGSATRINSDSGLLTLANGSSISGGAFNLSFGGTGNITVSDVIATSTATVTKDGAGTLTLSGVNTFTGGVILAAGTLVINEGSGLGGNPTGGAQQLTFTGNSTLRFGHTPVNQLNSSRIMLINNGVTATIDTQAFNASTAAGISGFGALTKIGSGTFTLAGADSYSGGTTINAGTLTLSGAGVNSGVMPYTINAGGSLILDNVGTNNTNRIADTSTISLNGGSFSFNGNAATASSETFGAISGTGSSLVTVTAGGSTTATVTAASFSHAVGNGSDLINGVGLGSSTVAKNFFKLTAAPTLVGTTDGASTGIALGTFNTKIIPFLVGEATSTTGGLGTASGVADTFLTYNPTTGLRPLNPTDEFDSSTTLTAGNNVRVTNATTTGTIAINSLIMAGADLSINDGATLTDTSGALLFTTSNAIKPTGTTGVLAFGSTDGMVTVSSGVSGTISTKITGTNGLTKSGAGTLTLSGTIDNADFGATLYAGTLVLAKASTSIVHAVGGYNATDLTINGGTAQLGGSGGDQIYDGGNLVVNTGGTFDMKGFSEGVAALSGTGGSITNSGAADSALTIGTSADGSTPTSGIYSGVISDGATNKISLTKMGAATLTLAGANTYTGATTISAGTLQIGNGGTTGSLSATSAITDNGNVVFNRSNTVTQGTDFSNAAITGTGALTQSGTGTLVLNLANTYQGGTFINAGTLQFTTDSNLGSGSVTLNGGTLASAQLAGVTMTRTIATGTTGGTIRLNNGIPSDGNNKITLSTAGQITGSGPITLTNNGLLSIGAANNSYTGNWTLNGGVLELTNVTAAGSGSITVNSGAELTTLGSQITNALILNGGSIGWDFFSGSGDYQGPVTLQAGGGTVSLVNFYGAGAINGTISGNITGPGGLTTSDSGPSATTSGGVLTLSGNNNYTGGNTIGVGTTVKAASGTALGASTNSLSLAGTLYLNGNNLTIGALSAPGGGTFSFTLGASTADKLTASSASLAGTNDISFDVTNLSGTGAYNVISSSGGGLTGAFEFAGASNLSVPVNSLIVKNSSGSYFRLTLNNTNTAEQVVVSSSVPSKVLTILPFGSSITAGQSAQVPYNGGGYHPQLYQDLVNDGRFTPNFIGSSTSLLATTPTTANILTSANQTHHEGHPGWTTSQMLANLGMSNGDPGANGGNWLNTPGYGTPDYVTVNIGGNDAVDLGTDQATLTAASHRLDATVSKLNSLSPGVATILSSIAYRGDGGGSYSAGLDATYNPLMGDVVFNHVLAGQNVSFLDLRNIMSYPTDMSSDTIHPTQAGYNKMANAWYQSIAYGSAYWTGSQGSNWSTVNGSSTNFAMDRALTTDRQKGLNDPSANTFFIYPDVYFSNNAGALATTLGADLTIRSLNFTGGATGSVTIGAGNTLTIGSIDSSVIAGNTYTLNNTGGITVQAGSGAHTIAANVVLGADQTWGNVSSNPLRVSGNIGGAHDLSFVGSYTVYNPGTYSLTGTDYSHSVFSTTSSTVSGTGGFILSGANTYSGATTITNTVLSLDNAGSTTARLANTSRVTLNSGGTLLLVSSSGSSTNRINNSTPLTLAGGTFNTGGLSEGTVSGTTPTQGIGALTLTANSVIDLGGGASVLTFANSNAAAWTSGMLLKIYDWTGNGSGGGTDQIFFGNDGGGLSSGQLGQIAFYSDSGSTLLGMATILSDGEIVPVPEPSTIIASIMIAAGLLYGERRRVNSCFRFKAERSERPKG
jgi:autotransporter-associated beta strand protein